MKRIFTLAVTLLVAGAFNHAFADNVTVEQAQKAAARYFDQNSDGHKHVTASDLTLAHRFFNPKQQGVVAVYMFNVADGGWIALSGTTLVDPLVAYADEGEYIDGKMPSNMMYLLNQYVDLVSNRQDMCEGNEKNAGLMCGEWGELLDGTYTVSTKSNKILLSTSWDQGNPYGSDGYNLYCPQYQGSYCYVGCVAVAMGQIIRYFQFPVTGKLNGNTTFNGTSLVVRMSDTVFNYSNMPNKLTNFSSQAQKREVAKLLYCAGVCVGMSYGVNGSGAFSARVPTTMKSNFRYRQGKLIERNNDQDQAFIDSIRRDLTQAFPVYMSGNSSTGTGRDAAGHAWVCDGFQTQNNTIYHMNWGWGGSNNAWFNLSANQMGSSVSGSYNSEYTFNLHQEVIVRMTPPMDSLRLDSRFDTLFNSITEVRSEVKSIYPNPATGNATLTYSLQREADLVLYNIEGRAVSTQRVQGGEGAVSINLSGLPAGIYIYRLGSAAGKLVVK